jgi:hypothetical protein
LAAGTYSLQVVDDAANYVGTFESWSLTIESTTFPERYDGRAEDGRSHDGGICSVTLQQSGSNLILDVDPFTPGDAIVRYGVRRAGGAPFGQGTVIVEDCAGNTCQVPVFLAGLCGDFDDDGDTDLSDYAILEGCLDGPGVPYAGGCSLTDMDVDGDVDLGDFSVFSLCFE